MRRLAFTSLFLIALSPAAFGQTIERLNILDYGVYTATGENRVTPTGGTTATGDVRPVTNLKLVKQTDTIVAKPGLRFGLRYWVVGKPKGERVTVKFVTRFPKGGVTNAKGEKFEKNEFDWQMIIGETSYRTYTFDEPWEMVAGDWALEFWYDGKKIGEKRFKVIAP